MSKDASDEQNAGADKGRYRAPALQKGLSILEILAGESEPMTLSAISEALSRSRSEIFRMVQELEICGYIQRSDAGEGYEVTNKLFMLGFEQPRTKTLIEAALPHMRDFVETANQSCHIAVQVDNLIVVIARMEAPSPVALSVRVGHRQALATSTSGPVIFAFQSDMVQRTFIQRHQGDDPDLRSEEFAKLVSKIRRQGYFKQASRYVRGVSDLSAPIMRGTNAIAAFTAPCLQRRRDSTQTDLPIEELKRAAAAISDAIYPF